MSCIAIHAFPFVISLILAFLFAANGVFPDSSLSKSHMTPKCGVTVATVLCRDEKVFAEKDSTLYHAFGRQMAQIIALLRSVALAERYSPNLNGPNELKCIHVIVLANHIDIFEELVDTIYRDSSWDPEFSQYLELSYVPAVYPKEHDWMSSIYRPCATIRLFLDTILPNVDSVIYTDTDIIYLKSLQYLWKEFYQFTPSMIAGLVPEKSNSFFIRRDYNPSAYNSGIMLMNLTRMREVDWSRRIGMVCKMYLEDALWADQDILVIYFQHFPDQLYDISCDWNFAPRNCQFGKVCAPNGISAVHGLAGSFVKSFFEIYFKALFNAYRYTPLNDKFSLKNFTSFVAQRAWVNHDAFHTSWHHCHVTENWADLVIASIHRFETFAVELDAGRPLYQAISKPKQKLSSRIKPLNATISDPQIYRKPTECISIALTYCHDRRQTLKQTLEFIKTVVSSEQNTTCFKVNIVSAEMFSLERLRDVMEAEGGQWQKNIQLTFVLSRPKPIYEWTQHISRVCETLTLFYPEILADEDAILHLDSMRFDTSVSVKMLWEKGFSNFSKETILAAAILPKAATRNHAAIMAMNLTKMRGVGFSNTIRMIAPFYRDREEAPNKGIAGLYFSYFPEQLASLKLNASGNLRKC